MEVEEVAEDLDSHTTEFAACACACALYVPVSQYIKIRYVKPTKCVLQQNAMALFPELSLCIS